VASAEYRQIIGGRAPIIKKSEVAPTNWRRRRGAAGTGL